MRTRLVALLLVAAAGTATAAASVANRATLVMRNRTVAPCWMQAIGDGENITVRVDPGADIRIRGLRRGHTALCVAADTDPPSFVLDHYEELGARYEWTIR